MLSLVSKMACDSPLTVFPKVKVLSKPLLNKDVRSYGVPCGKCPPCIKSRISGWRFRLEQEEKVSLNTYFITLTYDTQYVPITNKGWLTLDKKALTLFMKKLRIKQSRHQKIPKDYPKIKYYACAEYGNKMQRPHYHIILFNIYNPLDIPKSWQYGEIDIQSQPSSGSFAYTAGYMNKKTQKWKPNDDRVKEFTRMSKNLGISYVENKANIKWHLADIENRCYVSIGAKKEPMPRYYKNKIYTEQQLQRIGRHAQIQAEKELQYNDTLLEHNQKIGRIQNHKFHQNKKIR